ncbi:SMU1112c/YaeR family gloxylase I-like metalloprotein [Streptococcus suis]|uniref:Lactoylglutathione lyase and related lyases n=1 Tax=Streptococcus suis TaxID=1307 RepID=A0A0Z8J7L7_STRSU|nr:VOC family protein [Streptococcus suis]NQG68693.1 VOC family protein [Streptococcus suis]NQH23021.1 VOC family protein [Streptococcus suis]CYU83726.1 lactoylglutathione lyase and related lyases [Streptococcus suis]CYV48684.1 lactoylglutathione lyase and related lyases [Streptococcus suis]HEL1740427.1 VOC family protein [Streptococcus suis]
MKFDAVHHIAIIGSDYDKTREFYVEKLGFEQVDEHIRPEKNDILFNVKKGNLILEIFIKPDAPMRPAMPNPEHTGLRHLAFQVADVEACLEEFDHLDIRHEVLRTDDFDGKKMAFFFDPDGLPLEIHE